MINLSFKCIDCPDDWLDARSLNLGCINFHTAKQMEWQDAQDFCESMHESYLVEIFDQGTFTIYVTRLVADSTALYRLLGPRLSGGHRRTAGQLCSASPP